MVSLCAQMTAFWSAVKAHPEGETVVIVNDGICYRGTPSLTDSTFESSVTCRGIFPTRPDLSAVFVGTKDQTVCDQWMRALFEMTVFKRSTDHYVPIWNPRVYNQDVRVVGRADSLPSSLHSFVEKGDYVLCRCEDNPRRAAVLLGTTNFDACKLMHRKS
ncbi:MAG: hypothetical protein P0S94_02150 [Simkaniaceae bacterium]|nr:hypothetical protein [Simkaniaceae bacterium]